jgi:hypothetical protein
MFFIAINLRDSADKDGSSVLTFTVGFLFASGLGWRSG